MKQQIERKYTKMYRLKDKDIHQQTIETAARSLTLILVTIPMSKLTYLSLKKYYSKSSGTKPISQDFGLN